MALLGTANYQKVRPEHQSWIAEFFGNKNRQDNKWTKSIAVGSKDLVGKVKFKLGVWRSV